MLRMTLPAVQGLGMPSIGKVTGDDLAAFVVKVKHVLLTDGNTKLKPNARVLARHLLVHGPAFGIDRVLLVQAVIKAFIGEALSAVANAELNRIALRDSGTTG